MTRFPVVAVERLSYRNTDQRGAAYERTDGRTNDSKSDYSEPNASGNELIFCLLPFWYLPFWYFLYLVGMVVSIGGCRNVEEDISIELAATMPLTKYENSYRIDRASSPLAEL